MKRLAKTILLLISTCTAGLPKDVTPDELTTHANRESVISIPFPVEMKRKQTGVFNLPMVGVKILEVQADGTNIPPVDALTNYDGLDVGSTNVEAHFIYKLGSGQTLDHKYWNLPSLVELNRTNMVIRDFLVPQGSKMILIKYRVRYPDFSLAKPKTLLSRWRRNN